MKNTCKISALLMVLIMTISMFVACGDKNDDPPVTPPANTEEETNNDPSGFLNGSLGLPEGEKMQIPPTSGTYYTGIISLGTYSTYTFSGNEYEFNYYKFGNLDITSCHKGTFTVSNGNLVLTVMATDPETGTTNVVETKTFEYGRYADGRLQIGASIFTKMEEKTN